MCVDKLPARSARLFMMREWLELEIADICTQLDVSTSHCSVMLFRARLQLRECLQIKWVGDAA
jgi:RNA polymerase sigma-70 factor (ECF subfamily)